MSVDVVTQVDIAAPREEVAAYAGDPDNAPTWYVNIESVRWVRGRVAEVGAQMAFVARFLGREMAYTYEIVELVPLTRMVMRTSDGPFPMETTYEWEDAPEGGTRMTLRNRGEPVGFARVTKPAMVHAMKRANRKDLALLKSLLEARGSTTP